MCSPALVSVLCCWIPCVMAQSNAAAPRPLRLTHTVQLKLWFARGTEEFDRTPPPLTSKTFRDGDAPSTVISESITERVHSHQNNDSIAEVIYTASFYSVATNGCNKRCHGVPGRGGIVLSGIGPARSSGTGSGPSSRDSDWRSARANEHSTGESAGAGAAACEVGRARTRTRTRRRPSP
jgi:hypothetical protein